MGSDSQSRSLARSEELKVIMVILPLPAIEPRRRPTSVRRLTSLVYASYTDIAYACA